MLLLRRRRRKPRRRQAISVMAGGSKQGGAMKRPQRGLGVAELERIRLQEEQQEQHLLFRHRQLQLQRSFDHYNCRYLHLQPPLHHLLPNPRIDPHADNTPSPTPYFFIIPHADSSPPQPTTTTTISFSPSLNPNPNPNPTPSLINNSAGLLPTIHPAVHLEQEIQTQLAYGTPPAADAIATIPRLPPHSSLAQNPNAFNPCIELPVVSICKNITPHENRNINMSNTPCHVAHEEFFKHPIIAEQELPFFPLHPSLHHLTDSASCKRAALRNAASAAAIDNIRTKYKAATQQGDESASTCNYPLVDDEEMINLSASAYFLNNCSPSIHQSQKLSPALQNSEELELPSFQKQLQDMNNHYENEYARCTLDLNYTQGEEDNVENMMKHPSKKSLDSQNTMDIEMNYRPRDTFLKLGPPITSERRDNKTHVKMCTKMMKHLEDLRQLDSNLCDLSPCKSIAKGSRVVHIDLSLKLSLPSLEDLL